MFNITSREQVIVNTWYGGEMKKGMFSMMNYYLPLKGIASMHCSANTDMNGENTALFFGLSGTGKTTLSTDPKRLLIGDDEHGWDDNGERLLSTVLMYADTARSDFPTGSFLFRKPSHIRIPADPPDKVPR